MIIIVTVWASHLIALIIEQIIVTGGLRGLRVRTVLDFLNTSVTCPHFCVTLPCIAGGDETTHRPSRETYQMAKRFIASELNTNPNRSITLKILAYPP